MRRMSLAVCVLVIGCVVLAAGCKPNLRIVGNPSANRLTPNKVRVEAVIKNASRGDADHPFKVTIRCPISGAVKDIAFGHGLKKGKSRPINAVIDANNTSHVGKPIHVHVDPADVIEESNEGDNHKITHVPPP